jgi:hypothetical protein
MSWGMMDVATIMRRLEEAQTHAYPGRESVERDSVLRELWRALRPVPTAAAPVLRLVTR